MEDGLIVVSEAMDVAGLEILRRNREVLYDPSMGERRGSLLQWTQVARALVVRNRTRVDEELLEHAPDLRVVGRLGAGLDNLDLDALNQRRISVVYAPGLNANAVAEWTVASILSLLRRLGPAHRHVLGGGWNRGQFMSTELADHTLGILGMGNCGTALARHMQSFSCRMITYHPRRDRFQYGVERVSFEELLAASSILSVLLPLTPETRLMLTERELRRLPTGALLVVAGRGGVADEEAAVGLLQEGHLGGIAFDVFEREPPLTRLFGELELDGANALLSPHAAGWTETSQRETAVSVARDVLKVLGREQPTHLAPVLRS